MVHGGMSIMECVASAIEERERYLVFSPTGGYWYKATSCPVGHLDLYATSVEGVLGEDVLPHMFDLCWLAGVCIACGVPTTEESQVGWDSEHNRGEYAPMCATCEAGGG